MSCITNWRAQQRLQAVQNATHRLSKLLARCEGAFEGIFLDNRGQHSDNTLNTIVKQLLKTMQQTQHK